MDLERRVEKLLKIVRVLEKKYKEKKIVVYNVSPYNRIKNMIKSATGIILFNGDYEKLKKKIDIKETITIDFYYITSVYNHLITADYEQFNFDLLFKELNSKEYEGIKWQNYRIPRKKGSNKIDYEKIMTPNFKYSRDHIFNYDDIVYIYYKNLPGINKKQVLLKCKVIDDGHIKNENISNNDCYYEDLELKEELKTSDKSKYCLPCIKIKIINCANKYIDDDSVVTYRDLEKIINLHGKSNLDVTVYDDAKIRKDKEKLLDKLERCISSPVSEFKKYPDIFCDRCSLINMETNYKHKTFLRANGLEYYEFHHLIERNTSYEKTNEKYNYKLIKEIVDKPENIFPLCSNCHNKIHYGPIEERKKMINLLYKLRKKEIDNLFLKLQKELPELKGKDMLKWLYSLYE